MKLLFSLKKSLTMVGFLLFWFVQFAHKSLVSKFFSNNFITIFDTNYKFVITKHIKNFFS
jgi:hypothetical protein